MLYCGARARGNHRSLLCSLIFFRFIIASCKSFITYNIDQILGFAREDNSVNILKIFNIYSKILIFLFFFKVSEGGKPPFVSAAFV